jgi:ATP-dependent DNA ligase
MVENAPAMDQPGHYRRQLLEAACLKVEDDSILQLSLQFEPTVESLARIWEYRGEGGVLKRRDAKYSPGKRSKDWIKCVRKGSATCTILGFLPGLNGPHSMVFLRDDETGVETSVKTLNGDWLKTFAVGSDEWIGRKLVISFRERTRDGSFRHPMWDHLL